MISAFTPAGVRILAKRSGFGIEAGETYTVRGFVVNRHARTGEPDPHVLIEELDHPVGHPRGRFGEIGFPRDAFRIPNLRPVRLEKREAILAGATGTRGGE